MNFSNPRPRRLWPVSDLRPSGEGREVELLPEFLVRFGGVSRHSEDLDFLTLESVPQVTESAGFRGTTGRVVARVEIKQEFAFFHVGARYFIALIVGGCKIGYSGSFFKWNGLFHVSILEKLAVLPTMAMRQTGSLLSSWATCSSLIGFS